MKLQTRFRWSFILLCIVMLVSGHGYAADTNGDYLKYQEPQPPASSWLSTIAYVFSLLVTFFVVIGLAYLTSRFMAQKMNKINATANGKVLSTLSLGPNRGLYIVEIANKVLVLGVTEHSITLLQEITSQLEIDKLKVGAAQLVTNPFDELLTKQLASLQQFSHKFPGVFKDAHENQGEKR